MNRWVVFLVLCFLLLPGAVFAQDQPAAGPDQAPDKAAEPAAADAPVKAKSSVLVSAAPAAIERGELSGKPGITQRIDKVEKDKPIMTMLYDQEMVSVGPAGKAICKVGNAKVRLFENTSLSVLEVLDDATIVDIMGIEMELAAETVIEVAFGSVVITQQAGAVQIQGNISGAATPVTFNIGVNQISMTIPAGAQNVNFSVAIVGGNIQLTNAGGVAIPVTVNGMAQNLQGGGAQNNMEGGAEGVSDSGDGVSGEVQFQDASGAPMSQDAFSEVATASAAAAADSVQSLDTIVLGVDASSVTVDAPVTGTNVANETDAEKATEETKPGEEPPPVIVIIPPRPSPF